MCRQFITCLLPLFSQRDESRYNLPNVDEIKASVGNYNRRFSGAPRPVISFNNIRIFEFSAFNEAYN